MKAGGRGITTAVVAEVVLHVYLLLWRSSSSVQADQGYGTSTTQMATCYNSDGSPISTTDVAVSTTAEATELGEHLLLCPGVEFTVSWRGSVTLAQPLAFSNGTFLKIAGFSEDSLIDGGGATHLFEVNGSSAVLDIEALSLTGGKGASGGVVVARDGAVVTLSACDVFENEAASKGGAVFLTGATLYLGGSTFSNNTASVFGGAVCATAKSTIGTLPGTENVFDTNGARYGGAIYADDGSSVLLVQGDDTLINNHAIIQGGAVYAETGSAVTTGGTTLFADNTAESNGGAIFAKNVSTVTATGNTSFVGNVADYYGGAVMVKKGSTITTSGETEFVQNVAKYRGGGAIQTEMSSVVRLSGTSTFLGNWAGEFGGAVSGTDSSTFSAGGDAMFAGNIADYGGAVRLTERSAALMWGSPVFDNNTASNDGGALHFTLIEASIAGGVQFLYNKAIDGSGGAIYCRGVDKLYVRNASFVGNAAAWGGGVATFSSGSQQSSSTLPSFTTSTGSSSESPESSTADVSNAGEITDAASSSSTPTFDGDITAGSVTYQSCIFGRNLASEDGGGIYSVAGFDAVRDSIFTKNRAGASGGALVHSGLLEGVSGTTFHKNTAGNEGPAILSLGLLNSMTNVTFKDNDFFCKPGTFSTEELSSDDDDCRFTEVCSRCASSCDSDLEAETSIDSPRSIPICMRAPTGAEAPRSGVTIRTLAIRQGYFRSSLTSTDIRECNYAKACHGGVELSEYCATGYGGPYCAVCKDGFAPGYSFTCKSCLGDSAQSAQWVAIIVFIMMMGVVSFIALQLVKVVQPPIPDVADGFGSEDGNHDAAIDADADPEAGAHDKKASVTGKMQKTLGAFQERMKTRFPLTAVKIVVVVWQIVTQSSEVAGVTYPGAYKDFLSVIDMVNLDLGFVLSFACIYKTDFYDRLLLATLGPILILMALGCTYFVALRRNKRFAWSVDEAVAAVKARHLSVALFVMFVVYGTVSHRIFETFVCEDLDDGETYLRADYSLKCTDSRHAGYQAYAAIMVLVYPVGIPCAFGWWLFQHRHELLSEEGRMKNPSLLPAADLWRPYKRGTYYYEVVECCRRIALTGIAVFVYPESSAQLAIVLLLAVVFMVVSEILVPFERSVEMWLYRAGHYIVFASMYLALLLRVDVSDEQARSQDVFSGVLVIAHAGIVLIVIANGVLMFMGWADVSSSDDSSSVACRESCINNADMYYADSNTMYHREPTFDAVNHNAIGWAHQRQQHGRVRGVEQKNKREKRWEEWERTPSGRSSFFPKFVHTAARSVLSVTPSPHHSRKHSQARIGPRGRARSPTRGLHRMTDEDADTDGSMADVVGGMGTACGTPAATSTAAIVTVLSSGQMKDCRSASSTQPAGGQRPDENDVDGIESVDEVVVPAAEFFDSVSKLTRASPRSSFEAATAAEVHNGQADGEYRSKKFKGRRAIRRSWSMSTLNVEEKAETPDSWQMQSWQGRARRDAGMGNDKRQSWDPKRHALRTADEEIRDTYAGLSHAADLKKVFVPRKNLMASQQQEEIEEKERQAGGDSKVRVQSQPYSRHGRAVQRSLTSELAVDQIGSRWPVLSAARGTPAVAPAQELPSEPQRNISQEMDFQEPALPTAANPVVPEATTTPPAAASSVPFPPAHEEVRICSIVSAPANPFGKHDGRYDAELALRSMSMRGEGTVGILGAPGLSEQHHRSHRRGGGGRAGGSGSDGCLKFSSFIRRQGGRLLSSPTVSGFVEEESSCAEGEGYWQHGLDNVETASHSSVGESYAFLGTPVSTVTFPHEPELPPEVATDKLDASNPRLRPLWQHTPARGRGYSHDNYSAVGSAPGSARMRSCSPKSTFGGNGSAYSGWGGNGNDKRVAQFNGQPIPRSWSMSTLSTDEKDDYSFFGRRQHLQEQNSYQSQYRHRHILSSGRRWRMTSVNSDAASSTSRDVSMTPALAAAGEAGAENGQEDDVECDASVRHPGNTAAAGSSMAITGVATMSQAFSRGLTAGRGPRRWITDATALRSAPTLTSAAEKLRDTTVKEDVRFPGLFSSTVGVRTTAAPAHAFNTAPGRSEDKPDAPFK